MENFELERNGYDKKQVDNYVSDLKSNYEQVLSEQKSRINELKKELEINKLELEKYVQKSGDISDALVVAVETAKQIESSSKNIYELEIKRIRALYDKWENFLDQMMQEYPMLKGRFDTKGLLKVFSDGIDNVIKQNSISSETPSSQSVGLRSLINKMSGLSNRQPVSNSNEQIKQTIFKSNDSDSYFNENLTSIGTVPQQSENIALKYQQLKQEQLRQHQLEKEQFAKEMAERKAKEQAKQQEQEQLNNFQQAISKTTTEKEEQQLATEFDAFSELLKKNEEMSLENKVEPKAIEDIKQPKKEVEEEPQEKKNVIVRKEKPNEDVLKTENKQTKIKSISNLTLNKDEKFDSLVDKFLSSDDDVEDVKSNEYEKALLNKKEKQNGFDLAEALNPQDDLSEIMKSFDVFNDELLKVDPSDDNSNK